MNYEKELAVLREGILDAGGFIEDRYKAIHPKDAQGISIPMDPGTGEVYIEIKEDGTPVTSIDKESKRILRVHLRSAFSNFRIVTEEDDEAEVRLAQEGSSEYMWVVDPLEGSKAFIKGNGNFG